MRISAAFFPTGCSSTSVTDSLHPIVHVVLPYGGKSIPFCCKSFKKIISVKNIQASFTFLIGNNPASVTEVSLGSDLTNTTAASEKEIIRESVNSEEDLQALKHETKKTGKHILSTYEPPYHTHLIAQPIPFAFIVRVKPPFRKKHSFEACMHSPVYLDIKLCSLAPTI